MLITIHKLTWKYIWSPLLSYTNDINIGLILVFITLEGSSRIFISEHKEFSHVVLHFHALFLKLFGGHSMDMAWLVEQSSTERHRALLTCLVPIKQKIKPMKSYGVFCYLCAPENPGFHGGETYSFKQRRSNSHKCMTWLPERQAMQLQQADLQQILQTLCTELVRAIFQNSISLHTWHARKSRTLRRDIGNHSVCYFSGILVVFFSPTTHGTSAKTQWM